jgi:zinc D-Ala-D-Ala dipeptidase
LTSQELPVGFVYIDDVDPSIISDLRYLTSENFVGKPLVGYKTDRPIITEQAAIALARAQLEFESDGYSIVVYDSYRPQRTVNYFVEWAKDLNDTKMKDRYYPYVPKSKLFELDYIAAKSGHSRGSTLDMTLIKLDEPIFNVTLSNRTLENGQIIPFLDDGTVDFGSSFDYFGEASHHDTPLVDKQYQDLRNYLRSVMKKNGFKDYAAEWWHYTLENEPFPDTYFNFVVSEDGSW